MDWWKCTGRVSTYCWYYLHDYICTLQSWHDCTFSLPFKRISTLFNVSNFVVGQVNFHVVPFLNKAHHPNINTLYWKLFQICMWDVRSRVLNLSSLGLFPKLFGQDVTKVFKQKYYGNLTLVPRFTTMTMFGLKAFQNPTVADMDMWDYTLIVDELIFMSYWLSFYTQLLARWADRRMAIPSCP